MRDLAYVATFIGEGAPRFYLPLDQQLKNQNFAQLMLMSKSMEARERVLLRVRETLAHDFPNVRSKADRLFNGPPVGWAVQVRVTGPDRDEVRRLAAEVGRRHARNAQVEQRARRLAGAGAEPQARHRPGPRPRARRHLAEHPPLAAGHACPASRSASSATTTRPSR